MYSHEKFSIKPWKNSAWLLHAPHGQPENGITLYTQDQFSEIYKEVLSTDCEQTCTDSITFLTYNNRKRESLIEEYECEMLFCSTVVDWPANITFKKFEEKKYNKSKYHNHLSAGIYMGRKNFIIRILEEIINMHEGRNRRVFITVSLMIN